MNYLRKKINVASFTGLAGQDPLAVPLVAEAMNYDNGRVGGVQRR